jgi:hypothetical protein
MKLDDQQSMEPIPEVVLTARDLRQLDPAISAALGVERDIVRSPSPKVAKAPADYRLTVIGILSVGIIASIALGAHYAYSRPEPEAPVAKQAWTALPERPQVVIEEELPAPPQPTLYRNPFDRSEVFELPPGLSKAEARDMVAQILLERARDRAR